MPVAMATAAAGIVIGVVLQTGLAIRFTSFLVGISGTSLLLALFITMAAAIILGMGMPTTAAYIMLAALLIPALIKLGVTPMAAHMFGFYFACLSAVTPPVALAVYAAASISKSSLWGAGWQAVKFAAAGFIVPFFFVYNPALLFSGPWIDIGRAVLTGTIGVIALAAGLEGYFIRVGPALGARDLHRGRLLPDRPGPDHRPHRSRPARARPRAAEDPGAGGHGRAAGESVVTRAAQAALTLIAGALLVGTVLYGIFRVYA